MLSEAAIDDIFWSSQSVMVKEKSVPLGANVLSESTLTQRIRISSHRCSKVRRSYSMQASPFDPPTLVLESTSWMGMEFGVGRFTGDTGRNISRPTGKPTKPASRADPLCRFDARALNVEQLGPFETGASASPLRRAQGPPPCPPAPNSSEHRYQTNSVTSMEATRLNSSL